MSNLEEIWIPLVDEPIGSIVAEIQQQSPEIDALVSTPHRLLAFRTFAYIRTGIVLGQLLFDNDLPPYDGSETWIEALLREPKHLATLTAEIRAVAEEVANDPHYAGDERLGPDDDVKARFRDFAKKKLAES